MSRRHSTNQPTLDVVLHGSSIAELWYTETAQQQQKKVWNKSKNVLFKNNSSYIGLTC